MNRLRPRSFISSGLALCFLVAVFTGVVLFIRPEGSIARRIGWHFLGLDKVQWECIHQVFVAALAVFAAAHLRYNWQALFSCFRKNAGVQHRSFLEPLAAVILAFVLASAAVCNLPPVSWLFHARGFFKNGTPAARTNTSIIDVEWLTIGELASGRGIPGEELLSRLARFGMKEPDPAMTLGEAAARLGVPPRELYKKLITR